MIEIERGKSWCRLSEESQFLSDWFPTKWGDKAVMDNVEHDSELVPVWLRGDDEIKCSHVVYLVGKKKPESPFIKVGDVEFKIVSIRYRRGFYYKSRYRVWYTELRVNGDKTEDYRDPRWPWALKWD